VISAKGKRVVGTCEWIRGHKGYHAWLNGNISLLWISGGPGKGKTMMSIFLTEDLEQKIPTMENTQLVYYFFSFQDENRNTGVTLLQSLIYQIVTKRPQLKTHLLPYINSGNSKQPELSLEPLWAIFKKLIQDPELGTMLCVLDGLDESDKEATQILLPRLVDLLSPTPQSPLSTTFRLIVVSRDISGLGDCTRIKLDPDNNESVHDDIEKFISIRVRDLSKIVGSRHECEREVQATLLERAEGTFLWVGFATYELTQKRTWTEVFDALKSLPSGLPAIYSRMLHQIPARHKNNSSRILQWVTMALRPLTLLEIATAIGLKPLSSAISLEHAIMDEITLCGSFLKVQDLEVTLIHQSVRDYLLDEKQHNNPGLEAFWITPNEAHLEMAQSCLQCIEQSSLQQKPLGPRVRPGEPPFLQYAAERWLEHAASCSELAAKLFDHTHSSFTQNRDKWWKIYKPTAEYWLFYDEIPPLLHIACALEIVPWVEAIVHESCSTGSEDDKILSPCLLDQKDCMGRTALHHAASTGNFSLVHLLVQSGADVLMECPDGTALHSAASSRENSGETVRFLLDQGAEIDAPNYDGNTALYEATRVGNRQIIRILCDRGASLQSVNDEGSPALHCAAGNGDVDTVQLLLDRGANPEAVDSENSTALHCAAENGDVDTVQLLLDRGASLDQVYFGGPTVLHIAVRGRDVDTVELLLDRGASLQSVNGEGLTALHYAAENGDVDTVQLLLDRGASLDQVYFGGPTVLHIAVRGRDVDTVELLLDRGADIHAKDGSGKTALHWAIFGENAAPSLSRTLDVVQLLLDRGADIQAKTMDGQTALHLATEYHLYEGFKSVMPEIVQLLLDRGADRDASNDKGETAFNNPKYIKFLESLDEGFERPQKRRRRK
jgi:ankyrin repeat protein